jgi:glycosyltransferase involved in cell wall biosynthesis
MDKVSILIPCYNAEEYLSDSIESALMQTWPHCEVIIVDDGSSDNSLSIARSYEGERVTIIQQSNQGASAARNRAFQAATGEYVQYLDADDLLHPRKIEDQITALQERGPMTVAVCSTVYFQDGKPPDQGRRAKGEDDIPWLSSDDPARWLVNLWTPQHGWGMVGLHAWLTPYSIIEATGPWNEDISLNDDGDFFTRALLNSKGVEYVDEVNAYYRQHEGERVSGLVSEEALRGLLQSIDTRRDYVLPRVEKEDEARARVTIARGYWKVAVRSLPMYGDISKKASDRARQLGMSNPPDSVLPETRKARITRKLFGWRVARYLQYWYRSIASDIA